MNLEALIKTQLDALPRWCKGLEGDHESHEWVTAYGQETSIGNYTRKWDWVTRMFPYYLCKHCHAVSTNFTETSTIKRVR